MLKPSNMFSFDSSTSILKRKLEGQISLFTINLLALRPSWPVNDSTLWSERWPSQFAASFAKI